MDNTALKIDDNSIYAKDKDGTWIWEKNYPKDINWNLDIDNGNMLNVFDTAVKKYAKSPAIFFGGCEYSYAEIAELVAKTASGLQKLGVKKGVKVGLFLPNNPATVVFYYGILKAGGTVVNYNPTYAEREVLYQMQDSDCKFMVTLDIEPLFRKLLPLLDKCDVEKIILCPADGKNLLNLSMEEKQAPLMSMAELIANDGMVEDVSINPDEDIAVLQYTGGTTGTPKGAMLTHKNIYANTYQCSIWFNNMEEGKDAQIAVLPLFHVFAMTVVMNLSVWNGMKMMLVPQFDMKDVLRLINDERPTHFPAVPSIFNMMGSYAQIENFDFSSLKFCLSGGAPLPAEVKKQFEEKTGAFRVGEGYGLTESSPVVTCNPMFGEMKVGSIGQPIPATIVEIVSKDDGKTILPIGEKGEICVRGPQVMKGYYNRAEETAKIIKNGRLHTGDVGYIDEDGFVYIVDRIKDLILVNGYNVYPRHVEEAVYMLDAVEECIVAGVPDKTRGEAVWAWIKPVDGVELSADTVKKFLRDKLSPTEMPRKIIIKNEPLPKTAVGKLSRKDLLLQEGISKS